MEEENEDSNDRRPGCRNHCRGYPWGGCGRHFASERAFDWHRQKGQCLSPEEVNEARAAEDPPKKPRFHVREGFCDLTSPREEAGSARHEGVEVWAV